MIISELTKELLEPLEKSLVEMDNAVMALQTLCAATYEVASQGIKDESLRTYVQGIMEQIEELVSVLLIESSKQKASIELVEKNIEATMQLIVSVTIERVLEKQLSINNNEVNKTQI